MSADNYVVIRKFPDGWRWGCFFASDELSSHPDEKFRSVAFKTSGEAANDAVEELVVIEYGIRVEGE